MESLAGKHWTLPQWTGSPARLWVCPWSNVCPPQASHPLLAGQYRSNRVEQDRRGSEHCTRPLEAHRPCGQRQIVWRPPGSMTVNDPRPSLAHSNTMPENRQWDHGPATANVAITGGRHCRARCERRSASRPRAWHGWVHIFLMFTHCPNMFRHSIRKFDRARLSCSSVNRSASVTYNVMSRSVSLRCTNCLR